MKISALFLKVKVSLILLLFLVCGQAHGGPTRPLYSFEETVSHLKSIGFARFIVDVLNDDEYSTEIVELGPRYGISYWGESENADDTIIMTKQDLFPEWNIPEEENEIIIFLEGMNIMPEEIPLSSNSLGTKDLYYGYILDAYFLIGRETREEDYTILFQHEFYSDSLPVSNFFGGWKKLDFNDDGILELSASSSEDATGGYSYERLFYWNEYTNKIESDSITYLSTREFAMKNIIPHFWLPITKDTAQEKGRLSKYVSKKPLCSWRNQCKYRHNGGGLALGYVYYNVVISEKGIRKSSFDSIHPTQNLFTLGLGDRHSITYNYYEFLKLAFLEVLKIGSGYRYPRYDDDYIRNISSVLPVLRQFYFIDHYGHYLPSLFRGLRTIYF